MEQIHLSSVHVPRVSSEKTMPAGLYYIGDPCYMFPSGQPFESYWLFVADHLGSKLRFPNGMIVTAFEAEKDVYFPELNFHLYENSGLMSCIRIKTDEDNYKSQSEINSLIQVGNSDGLILYIKDSFIPQLLSREIQFGPIKMYF